METNDGSTQTSDLTLLKHLLKLFRSGASPAPDKEEVRFELRAKRPLHLSRPVVFADGQPYQDFLACEGSVDGEPCELFAVGAPDGSEPVEDLIDGVKNLGRLSLVVVLAKVQVLGGQLPRLVGLISRCNRFISLGNSRHEPWFGPCQE